MSQLTYERQDYETNADSMSAKDFATWRWYILLPLFVFAIELFYRQLAFWRIIPGGIRWISDVAIVAIIVIVFLRMLMLDRIPIVLFLVFAASAIGITVALFEGQGVGATAYGWWRLFMYPLVGLYAYLMPAWPPQSAKWIMRICLFVMGFEALFQIGQFATGARPSDNLAGTFGRAGVIILIMFIFLVVAFGFGRWLSYGDWRYLGLTLAFGVISSTLGEMKLYPAAVIGMALITAAVQVIRGGQIRRFASFLIILALAVIGFISLFNIVFADLKNRQFQDYLSADQLDSYLGGSRNRRTGYSLSRNAAPLYTWQQNQRDPVTFLFGTGIGTWGSSRTLGFTGAARAASFYQVGGRSLSMFIQEGGLVGMLTLSGFFAITAITLYGRAKNRPGTDMAAMQFGLLIFTAMWPVWLWYLGSWLIAFPMLLYWITLGFALNPENAQNST